MQLGFVWCIISVFLEMSGLYSLRPAPLLLAGLAIVGMAAAFAYALYSHLTFMSEFRQHLLNVTNGHWTDKQKISALLQAASWVPSWRVSLCSSLFFTLLLAFMWCFDCEACGPANWMLSFILLFSASNSAQIYRMSHMEGDVAYRALRLLEPESPPCSFWSELADIKSSKHGWGAD